jgi:hypothetical protein
MRDSEETGAGFSTRFGINSLILGFRTIDYNFKLTTGFVGGLVTLDPFSTVVKSPLRGLALVVRCPESRISS